MTIMTKMHIKMSLSSDSNQSIKWLNFSITAVKEIQSELCDVPLFQFNSPERPDTPILPDTAPLAVELNEMPTDSITDGLGVKPRDTLLYIYTSGTTGFPKAAIITNLRWVNVIFNPWPRKRVVISLNTVSVCLFDGFFTFES